MALNDMGVEVSVGSGGNFEPIVAGKHYGLVHGIVSLGQRDQSLFNDDKGNPKKPIGQYRFIFELVKSKRNDGQNNVIHVDINATNGERGNFYKLVAALLDKSVDEDEVATYNSLVGLQNLLGKAVRLTVEQKPDKKGQVWSNVKRGEFTSIDEEVLPNLPKALRPTFVFSPMNPEHVKVFKENLTYGTQKYLMQALNAGQFPKELHQAWVEVEAEHNKKQSNKEQHKADTKPLWTDSAEADLPFEPDHSTYDASSIE